MGRCPLNSHRLVDENRGLSSESPEKQQVFWMPRDEKIPTFFGYHGCFLV